MRPPNEHAPKNVLPSKLFDLVAASLTEPTANAIVPPRNGVGFLKKAKGLQSLSIQLSWVYVWLVTDFYRSLTPFRKALQVR